MYVVKIERAYVEVVPDADPDTSYLYQDEPDFSDRREQFERGEFGFVGVRACAEIRFETPQGGWVIGPTVTTPGLWGIESDSEEEYIREVGAGEAAELYEELVSLGIGEARAKYAQLLAPTKLEYR